ncbi:MAG: hypothetical protein JW904_14215 [Spirochaetales bacterium]|nr:hypothetical protein [Spirochaetales bacterium]
MIHEYIWMGIYAVIYLVIFLIAGIIRKKFPEKEELSRKTSHFFGGIAALFIPLVIHSVLHVAILSAGFLVFLFVMRRLGHMKSIFEVGRKSIGVFLFPITIFIIYFLAKDIYPYYFVAILVLTFSDSAAALIGTKYGSVKFEIEDNTKSLEGSVMFAVITFLCVQIPLLLMTSLAKEQVIVISLIIAVVVTLFESLSPGGSDNFFVPLGTYYITERMSHYALNYNLETCYQLLISMAIVLAVFTFIKAVKWSGKIVIMLVNFTCLSLIPYTAHFLWTGWFVTLVMVELFLALAIAMYTAKVENTFPNYQVKPALYIGLVPVILIFIAAGFQNYDQLFLPYIAAFVAQGTLLATFFFTQIQKQKKKRSMFFEICCAFIASILTSGLIATVPVFLFSTGNYFIILGMVSLASFLATVIYILLARLFHDKKIMSSAGRRQKLRVIPTVICVLAVYFIQFV